MREILSKSININNIFLGIAGIPDPETGMVQPGTALAEPGDLVFCITHYPYKNFADELKGKSWKETIRFRSRLWAGFDKNDLIVGMWQYILRREKEKDIKELISGSFIQIKKWCSYQAITTRIFCKERSRS